jgi:hypothetical protein
MEFWATPGGLGRSSFLVFNQMNKATQSDDGRHWMGPRKEVLTALVFGHQDTYFPPVDTMCAEIGLDLPLN